MTTTVVQTLNVQTVEHAVLNHFVNEFGTRTDLSRYETIGSDQRVTDPEAAFLNQLQMDSFIPTHTALLLKNNLHDIPFITHTSRNLLYDLKQNNKIGENCFKFLHERLNAKDFLSVFRYLNIIMLYTKSAEAHDAQMVDRSFGFEAPAVYSDRLVKSSEHIVAREENSLQDQSRKQFMKQWLTQLRVRRDTPQDIQNAITATISTIENPDPKLFRTSFISLLKKLENAPELEKICWKEFESNLSPFQDKEYFNQAYLHLKTETYYKYCLSRVVTLSQSLERTGSNELASLSEKCKKAYNGCVYLLRDSKNMAACSSMRFSALIGKMRTEWQTINNAFNRAQAQYAHRLCSCQVQAPATQNKLAEWPFSSHPLIDLNPAQPITPQQLQQRAINQETFNENSKKTIAVVGCKWGGGHKEIARGISNNLASIGYHPITVDLPEILISQDPVRNFFLTRWLGKEWNKASLYIGLVVEKAFAMANALRWFGNKFYPSKGTNEVEVKLILEHLLKINPNAVAVDYSANNESLIKACEILGIPLLHVGADINNLIETRDKPVTYPHFKMALPFNVPEVINSVTNTTTAAQRVITGPPVKHEFLQPRTHEDIVRLKQKWGIDINKKVVVIANGMAGANSPYAEMLAKKYATTRPEEIPMHLVVICGQDNQAFQKHLVQNVEKKTNLPMTIQLYTTKMEELMAMASEGGILIGKAGTSTIFEAIVRGTRLLIDNVPPPFLSQGVKHFFITCLEWIFRKWGFKGQIFWEKDNMVFTKERGLADEFKAEKDFLPKLEKMLNNDNQPFRMNLELKNVEAEIPVVLSQMLRNAQLDLNALRSREVHRTL